MRVEINCVHEAHRNGVADLSEIWILYRHYFDYLRHLFIFFRHPLVFEISSAKVFGWYPVNFRICPQEIFLKLTFSYYSFFYLKAFFSTNFDMQKSSRSDGWFPSYRWCWGHDYDPKIKKLKFFKIDQLLVCNVIYRFKAFFSTILIVKEHFEKVQILL